MIENDQYTNGIPPADDYTPEEVMLRHHFLKPYAQTVDVQQELARFHRKQQEGAHWNRFTVAAASFAAGVAAVVIFMFTAYPRLFPAPEKPVTVFLAASRQADGVTLQRADGNFLVVDDKQETARLKEMGITLHDEAGELVYDKDEATYHEEEAPQMQILTTPKQKVFSVVLSDGTEVSLNASSQLSYPDKFTGKERVVHLRGEAYFKVAKDAEHPFIVQTPDVTTRVLGTEFNFRSYSTQNTHVTLLSGSVQVSSGEGGAQVTIRPGEDAHLTSTGSLDVKEVDTDLFCSWKDGYFYFDGATLVDVMRELGRWYNVDVVFNKHRAMHTAVHFTADRNAPLQEAIDLINSLDKATVRLVNNQLVVD